ncbi:MAG: mannonate dehydratase [Bacteroidetes bacterium 4572_77]|nr:MAG: mannonate dehydratase [Bacteroidetes bacterium 4572_77]
MSMKKTWRWYGEQDSVTFSDIKQADVTNIVTSLSKIPYGEVWAVDDIQARKNLLENNGLKWSVVESIPVHEDIKTQTGNYLNYIENYKKSIENIAACGIDTVCYNFMPIMDWTRTNIEYELPNGAKTLRFELELFIAFDLFILKRENAELDYSSEQITASKKIFKYLNNDRKEELTKALIANLPGTDKKYTISEFKQALAKYEDIDRNKLKKHLYYFLNEIIPVAEKNGVKMCIHPDDPPFSLLGLPRIVSTENDITDLINSIQSKSNGLTFCTGSLGVIANNNLESIFSRFAHKVHFIHLRSTERDDNGNFHEANHLGGDVDMYSIVKLIIEEQERRKEEGRTDYSIYMRPDHGHKIMDDLNKEFYPGYSCIGRMKGLAELTGLEFGIEKSLGII